MRVRSNMKGNALRSAISLRRRPPEANAVNSGASSRRSTRIITTEGLHQCGENLNADGFITLALMCAATCAQSVAKHVLIVGALNAPDNPRQRVKVDQLAMRYCTVEGACGPTERNNSLSRSAAAVSSGMTCDGSVSCFSGSHKCWATNLISNVSGAGQGWGKPVAQSDQASR